METKPSPVMLGSSFTKRNDTVFTAPEVGLHVNRHVNVIVSTSRVSELVALQHPKNEQNLLENSMTMLLSSATKKA